MAAVTATIPGTSEGTNATVQVRAWDNTSGLYPDWASAEPAWNLGLIAAGKAPSINVTGLGGFGPPAYLCGLVSFNLYYKPVAPFVTTQPTNQSASIGQSATFTVGAAGTAPLSYQWRFNSNPISGATTNPFTIASVQLSNGGPYTVVITNTVGSTTSQVANLWIRPYFTTQPNSRTNNAGSGATFSASALGYPSVGYQWQFNGNAISGATSNVYSLGNVQLSNAGPYQCVATNVGGSATSDVATLTVLAPPQIVTQPANPAVAAGQPATFSVGAIGTAPLSYQWRFSDNPLSGATNTSYTVAHVWGSNAGPYTVVLTNLYGSVTSAAATVSFLPATNLTWTGAGTTPYWSDNSNWDPAGRGVGSGDTLIFPAGAAQQVNTNDLTGLVLNEIRFTGGPSGYQLSGNALTLTNALQSTNSAGTNTLNVELGLATADLMINCSNGPVLVLAGPLLGTQGFVKTGNGLLILRGALANDYVGDTYINQGTVGLQKTAGAYAIGDGLLTIGDGAGSAGSARVNEGGDYQVYDIDVRVNSDGLLDLNGHTDRIGNTLTLDGGGRIQSTGAGLLQLLDDSTVAVLSGTSHIQANLEVGTNAASTCTWTQAPGGILFLDQTISGAIASSRPARAKWT